MSPSAVELLRLLALLVLVGSTVWVLVRRDQPASAALLAGLVGIWAAVAAPHLRRLPARLHSVSVQTWTLTAVQTMEALHGGERLLFPAVWRGDRKRLTRSRSRYAMAASITRFIDYINARHPAAIPADPHGRIAPIRFRCTLAWHLANQPRGLVALAIRYGHLRTAISEGYQPHQGRAARPGRLRDRPVNRGAA